MRQVSWSQVCWLALIAMLLLADPRLGQAQEQAAPRPWTLEEALEQLRWYPHDTYLQYVALQLARREERVAEIATRIERSQRRATFFGDNTRAEGVNLFSLFSGALAIQESLQLDAMLVEPGFRTRRNAPASGDDGSAPVALSSLTGPTIKSHPWKEMLGDKQPEISPLARCVPDDAYFVEFRRVSKLLELVDTGDLWGKHLFSQSTGSARTQLIAQRLPAQLAIETNSLLRPFYDLVVTEAAITGSDLYLREGSDVTLLFRFRQPEVFKRQMERFLANAEQLHPGARRTTGEIQGVPFVHVSTPDRSLHVFAAYPQPDLHVRSNSRVGLERVLAAIAGRTADGKGVTRLGDTTEFAYIRSLMPRGEEEEDGFVYLSDPFIRRLVGPQLKLTERRRMLCYNHLRMIGHAGLMYQTESGKAAGSLTDLQQANCTPGTFGEGELACPDGGKYSLAADGLSGVCSHHGHAGNLIPCCEIPLSTVTRREAEEYNQFLAAYNQYWRTFFDPIALRLQLTPQRYRLETIVLPLIDNSIYTGLARATSGPPEALDALPIPKRNIFSLAVRLNKRELLSSLGLGELIQDESPEQQPAPDQVANQELAEAANLFKMLGLAMHNYHDAHRALPTAVQFDKDGKKNQLSWRVHLLPFLDHADLYDEFKRDEPWDSEHNRKLIAKMPDIYKSTNQQLNEKGLTRMVAPVGKQTVFRNEKEKVGFQHLLDGTSNTALLVEADDEHAVIWTKPDDLPWDSANPKAGLAVRPPGGTLFLIADGSVAFLRSTVAPETLVSLMTRDGAEPQRVQSADRLPIGGTRRQRQRALGVPVEVIQELQLAELLSKGLGNQVGFHVYDAEPMFAFNLPRFLGMVLGTFQGRSLGGSTEMLGVSALVASLNSPIYFSIPVKDPNLVDLFLGRLDAYLALAFRQDDWGILAVKTDLYRLPLQDRTPARAFTLEFGPVKWRFFWARIGNGLYLASKPQVLDDLVALQQGSEPARSAAGNDPAATPAHGLIRLRPENWQRVLASYQLGWAENHRDACLQNLGPLSNASRGLGKKAEESKHAHAEHVHDLAAEIYDARFFCPEGGQYLIAPDGTQVTCSVHGSKQVSRQQSRPDATSKLGRLLEEFRDLTVALTFLEDGLHAVVTIERKE